MYFQTSMCKTFSCPHVFIEVEIKIANSSLSFNFQRIIEEVWVRKGYKKITFIKPPIEAFDWLVVELTDYSWNFLERSWNWSIGGSNTRWLAVWVPDYASVHLAVRSQQLYFDFFEPILTSICLETLRRLSLLYFYLDLSFDTCFIFKVDQTLTLNYWSTTTRCVGLWLGVWLFLHANTCRIRWIINCIHVTCPFSYIEPMFLTIG